jgi:hypothetical protein
MESSIAVSKVEVRSGPSATFYATGELRQGDKVVIIREAQGQPGWLEIRPPAGSFDWVNAKNVKQINAYEAVALMEVHGLVGSGLVSTKPSVETKPAFSQGYVFWISERPMLVDGETWLPVKPHLAETRYIPADAIRAITAASPTAPTNWAIGGSAGSPPTSTIPGHPSTGSPANGKTTSYSPSPQSQAGGSLPPATTYPAQWSTYGILRATTFTKDGQPVYALVDRQERNQLYVTTKPGTSLKSYVNQTVSLYGPLVYRPDDYIRTPYMIASHVAVPPTR